MIAIVSAQNSELIECALSAIRGIEDYDEALAILDYECFGWEYDDQVLDVLESIGFVEFY